MKDLVTGAVVRASVDDAGNLGNDNSSSGSISGNGHFVAFMSQASNFSSLATNFRNGSRANGISAAGG